MDNKMSKDKDFTAPKGKFRVVLNDGFSYETYPVKDYDSLGEAIEYCKENNKSSKETMTSYSLWNDLGERLKLF